MITELGRGTRFRDRREGLRMALEALVATYARQHTSQVDWIGGHRAVDVLAGTGRLPRP